MMGWEDPLKEQHARVMCGQGGGHYLNVGFGLGIIDTYIQVRRVFWGKHMCSSADRAGLQHQQLMQKQQKQQQ